MIFQKRDSTIDILKGFGIILMVMGHAGCPQLLHDYIYTFHMPLFFIASGYFFSDKSILNKLTFFIKKVKGIYVPFLLCSLAFLLLHNVFFKIGIINDCYGAVNGSVSHLYSYKEMATRALQIVLQMKGYEGFLLGAFWFLRALFLSSLILCFGTWVLNHIFKETKTSILILALACLLCGGIIKYSNISIPFIPQGGYREMVGVFFMGAGYMMKKNIEFISSHKSFLIVSLVISVLLFIIHPASIALNSDFVDWMVIPFSGITGTYIMYCLSKKCCTFNGCKVLAYVGQKSIWILVLHFLAFKLSELFEIWIYDLPIQMIGCHTIIPPLDNWFFIIHTVIAVSIPISLAYCVAKIKKEVCCAG